MLLKAVRDQTLRSQPHEELRKELLGLDVKETLTGFRVDHKVGRFDDHVMATLRLSSLICWLLAP